MIKSPLVHVPKVDVVLAKKISSIGFTDYVLVAITTRGKYDEIRLLSLSNPDSNPLIHLLSFTHANLITIEAHKQQSYFLSSLEHIARSSDYTQSMFSEFLYECQQFHDRHYSDCYFLPFYKDKQRYLTALTKRDCTIHTLRRLTPKKSSDILNCVNTFDYIPHSYKQLTKQQLNVLSALSKNNVNQVDLARKLNRSPETIKGHIANIREKTGVRNIHYLIAELIRYKLIV